MLDIRNSRFVVNSETTKIVDAAIIQSVNNTVVKAINNTFTVNRATDSDGIRAVQFRSSDGLGETLQINNNTVFYKSYAGGGLLIGADAVVTVPEQKNGFPAPELKNNKLYGPIYYDPTAIDESVTAHALLVGNNINAVVHGNIVNGYGYGLVIKGEGNATYDTWTTGGVSYNFIKNCIIGINVKGNDAVSVVNNTILYDVEAEDNAFLVGETAEAENTVFKNNLIAVLNGTEASSGTALINVANGSLTSDYNGFVVKDINTFGMVGATAYTTFADWVGAGYDTHSVCVIYDAGAWKVYLGSDPTTLADTLDYCPVDSNGKLVNRADNPLIDTGAWLTGVNDGGESDPWGKGVYRLPNIGADQGADIPKKAQMLRIGN